MYTNKPKISSYQKGKNMDLLSLSKKNQINANNNFAFNYKNDDAIINVLGYVMHTSEEETLIYNGAFGLPLATPDEMAEIFLGIQRLYSKNSGRRIRHECLHLTPEEPIDTEGRNRVIEICCQFALFYYYNGFQVVFSIHKTLNGYHAHYAVNTVNFYDGHKYPASAKLLDYQQNYAATLIGTITQKYSYPSPITWEEFEYSDSLYIPLELFEASCINK